MRKGLIALLLGTVLSLGAPTAVFASPQAAPVHAQEDTGDDGGDFPWGLLGLLGLAGLAGLKRGDDGDRDRDRDRDRGPRRERSDRD